MIELDIKDVYKLERTLKKLNEKGFAHAHRRMLADTANAAKVMAQNDVKAKMTIRNAFTLGSIRSKSYKMDAEVGSLQDYMKIQEFGGYDSDPIPTSTSSGEGRQPVRKKLPTRANKMRNISLNNPKLTGRRQRNAAALNAKGKYAYLDFGGKSKGIYKKSGGKRNRKIDMVWSLDKKRHYIPPRPWLRPAALKAAKLMPTLWEQAVAYQVERLKDV